MTRKIYWFIAALAFLSGIGIIIFNLNSFFYLTESIYSDIPITHYPNALLIQRSLRDFHQIPLWSGLIQSGYPFAANPLSGLAYLWGWVALLFPLPAGLNIEFVFHLLIGSSGMVLFLQSEGRKQFAAIFGAFSFIFSTKIFAHFAAGHLTMLYALMWTPWLFYFTKKAVGSKRLLLLFLPGVVFGLITTADPRWSIPAGMVWVIFLFSQASSIKEKIKILSLSATVALSTSAGIWLPLLQFVKLSSRAALDSADRTIYSLNFSNLFGLILPDSGGFAEWVIYPSAIVFLMVVYGVFLTKDNKIVRLWYVIAGVALLLSFGENIPLLKYFFNIPGISLLRVPSRFLWIFLFALAVIASFVVDFLLEHKDNYSFDRLFFIVPIGIFVILFAIGVFFTTGQLPFSVIWSLFFIVISILFIGLATHHKLSYRILPMAFGVLLIADLLIINARNVHPVSSAQMVNRSQDLASKLTDLPVFGRIYTPSYSLSQEEGAFLDIQQINGIDPLQLSDYVDYFKIASGVNFEGYSVTLPAFINGEPSNDNRNECPNLDRLAELNVGYIISDFPLDKCVGMPEPVIANLKFIYELPIELKIGHFMNDTGDITLMRYTPNQITVQTIGGGLLILSEIYYPGWMAKVDGQKIKVRQIGIFRAIDIPDGTHEIEFYFRPVLFLIGISIQLSSLLLILFFVVWERVNARKIG